jgi:60 kDa SS-A/Ro ribonucleoprotein
VWKKLTWGRLNAPDTWEVALSSGASGTLAGGADKREAWQRLLVENKLGALALLRNLRNLREAGVEEELVHSLTHTNAASSSFTVIIMVVWRTIQCHSLSGTARR